MNKTRPPRVVLINAKLGLNIHGLGGWCLLLLSFVLGRPPPGKMEDEPKKTSRCFVETLFYSRSIFKHLPKNCLNEQNLSFFKIARYLIPPPFLINHARINYH